MINDTDHNADVLSISLVYTDELRALCELCHEMLDELREHEQGKSSWEATERHASETIAKVEMQIDETGGAIPSDPGERT